MATPPVRTCELALRIAALRACTSAIAASLTIRQSLIHVRIIRISSDGRLIGMLGKVVQSE